VGLERVPLSFVSTIEELFGWKSSGSGLESLEYGLGIRDSIANYAIVASVHICSKALFIYFPVVRRYMIWATEDLLKLTGNNPLSEQNTVAVLLKGCRVCAVLVLGPRVVILF
jgi:hypothetical protein